MLASVSASCVFSSRRSSSETTRSSSATPSRCHPTRRAEGPAHQPKHPQSPRSQKVIFCVQGVISRLLANVYLHYVFDLWAHRWRRREAKGDVILVRYADDIVVGFQYESDAKAFWDAMRERLREFSLSLHEDKTRLIEFGRFAAQTRARRGQGKPETFNFLGFTFICGNTRAGRFLVVRKSRADRMRAKLKEIKRELWRMMLLPIAEQGKRLWQVLSGWLAHHAVPTNFRALQMFRDQVTKRWRRSLSRRSQRGGVTWERMREIADEWLPRPRILHPWPRTRFAVKHPR